MKPEQQQKAIAEACGWKFRRGNDGKWHTYDPSGRHIRSSWHESSVLGTPKYLNDLNVMQQAIVDHICGDAEMEKKFLFELNVIIDGYADSEDVPVICDYTMAQLCTPCWLLARAFLRTLNLWKDED